MPARGHYRLKVPASKLEPLVGEVLRHPAECACGTQLLRNSLGTRTTTGEVMCGRCARDRGYRLELPPRGARTAAVTVLRQR